MSITIDVPAPATRPPKKLTRCGVCDGAVPKRFIVCQECYEPTCFAHIQRRSALLGQAPRYLCDACCAPASASTP